MLIIALHICSSNWVRWYGGCITKCASILSNEKSSYFGTQESSKTTDSVAVDKKVSWYVYNAERGKYADVCYWDGEFFIHIMKSEHEVHGKVGNVEYDYSGQDSSDSLPAQRLCVTSCSFFGPHQDQDKGNERSKEPNARKDG